MDDQKFKDKKEEIKALENESLDQAAGGGGGLSIVCLHCGSTNTQRVPRTSGNPIGKMPWVWKCMDCGLTEDEWIQ